MALRFSTMLDVEGRRWDGFGEGPAVLLTEADGLGLVLGSHLCFEGRGASDG